MELYVKLDKDLRASGTIIDGSGKIQFSNNGNQK
jgi:hypothetical protein